MGDNWSVLAITAIIAIIAPRSTTFFSNGRSRQGVTTGSRQAKAGTDRARGRYGRVWVVGLWVADQSGWQSGWQSGDGNCLGGGGRRACNFAIDEGGGVLESGGVLKSAKGRVLGR